MDGRLMPSTLRAARVARRPDSQIANRSNPSGVLIPGNKLEEKWQGYGDSNPGLVTENHLS